MSAGSPPSELELTANIGDSRKPVVSWSPALNGDGVREGVRTYRVWGKESLTDAAWREVDSGSESNYRFFRVTVEIP